MKTQIYKNYSDFRDREDKALNGVSPEFAELNPEWEKQNAKNDGCWNCSYCSDCSGCSYCIDCIDCSGCSGCIDCIDCRYCSDCSGKKETPAYPRIENIHQKVLKAVSAEGALDMSNWHTCETTHCRAGWVVNLAGEDGKKLEAQTSTAFAAMMIYKASSPIKVPPTRFHDPEEKAIADIKRCAELEAALR